MGKNSFKEIFLRLRTEKHLTQVEAARELNVSKSTVSMWEMGKRIPSPALYEQIADFFNVDMDYIYGRTGIRQKSYFDHDGNELKYLTEAENTVLALFSKLNESGQEKAKAFLEDLAEIGKYTV